LPASNEMLRSVPLIGPDTEMASAMVLLRFQGTCCRIPVVDHLFCCVQCALVRGLHPLKVTGDWQPTSHGARFLCNRPAEGRAEVVRRAYRRMPRRPMMLRYRSTSFSRT